MDLPAGTAPRLLQRLRAGRKAASGVDYAVLTGLIAVAVLGAVVLTGDRVRSLFVASEETVGDGVAGLPLPTPPGGDGGTGGTPPPPAGQGAWAGSGAFSLTPASTPQTRSLTLTNVGQGLLTLGAPQIGGPGAAAFQILSTDCGALPPGDSCEVLIQATAGANGSALATLSIGGVQGGVPLSRAATGFDPILAWSGPASLSLDGTPPQTTLPVSTDGVWTLSNTGFAPAALGTPSVTGAGWSVVGTTCSTSLPAGADCTLTLRATATADGPLPAPGLSFSGAPALTPTAAASGFAAVLAWSGQTDLAIGAPPATPATVQQTLTLTNSGTLPATGVAPAVAGDPAFALVSTTCGATLAPGASCAATVSFTADADVSSASAQISAGGVPGAIAALSGSASGIAPALAWSGVAPALDGAPPQTLPVAGQATYTLTNTGNQDAAGLGTVSMSGAGWSLLGTTCGPTLAQGASCDATLRLEAAANGAFPGTLAIAGGPSLAIAGSAAGFAPALAWSGTSTFVLDGTPGPQPLPRTAQRTFTLTNAGTAPATGLSVGVSGADFDFAGTTCTTTLAVGASCTLTVAALASQNGTLAGTISSGGATPATLPLSATATGFAPAFAWSGASTFTISNPTQTPAIVERTLSLTNTGTLAGAPAAPTVSGEGTGYAFSLVSHTCAAPLAPGAACTATVRASFTDNVATATGTLSSGAATQALTGSATGFAATLAWTAVPADFSMDATNGGVAQPTNAAPGPTETATLQNAGTLASGPVTVALAGPAAAAFELVGDACTGQSLAPGATCTVGVRLVAGLFPGDYSLQLTASASPTAAAPVRTQRVVGPRFAIQDEGQSMTAGGWTTQGNVRRFRVDNVGNAAATGAGVNNLRALGFNWAVVTPLGAGLIGWASNPTGSITVAPGERVLFDVALANGTHLNTLRTLVPGNNTFTATPTLGGFALPQVSSTYVGAVSVSWSGMPAANSLNVATQSLAAPTNAAAGPTGTVTLTHTGNIPVADLAISFAGANPSSYQRNGGTCGAAFSPGGTCTVGFRLVAGQFPATYQAALRATATGLSGADSPTTSHEVFGPRFTLALDNGASPSYPVSGGVVAYNNHQGRIIQYNNVGNRAATGVTLTGSGLRRDGNDYRFAPGETSAGRGFVWSIYRTDQLNFALRLDSNSMPVDVGQTPVQMTVPPGVGLQIQMGLGWHDLLGNPAPPRTYTSTLNLGGLTLPTVSGTVNP